MVKIYADHGGWRIDVVVDGKVQRTAWHFMRSLALNIANEFAEHYGSRYEPLPIEKPADW